MIASRRYDHDLEDQADALLAQEPRSREFPAYTTIQFARRQRLNSWREMGLSHHIEDVNAGRVTFDLGETLRSDFVELCRLAKLTPKEAAIIWLRIEGLTFKEIGERFGHTKQCIYHRYKVTLPRLGAAVLEMTQWEGGYREQVEYHFKLPKLDR